MADRAPRGARQREPAVLPAGQSEPVAPAPTGDVGPVTITMTSTAFERPGPRVAPTTPRATFRHLQQQGLTAGEAASLTAFMCGGQMIDLRRSMLQMNHVLFLQRLYRLGRFGIGVDGRPRPN